MPPIKCTYVQLEVSTDKVPCNHCKQLFTTWGLKSHEASCICRQEKTRRRKEFTNAADKVVEAQMKGRHKEKWHLCRVQAASVIAQEQQPAAVPHPTPFNLDTLSTLSMDLTANAAMSSISDTSMAGIPDGPDELTLHLSVSTPPSANIQPDSFKTEFHPKSGHPMMVDSFSTFDCSQGQTQNQPMVDDDSQPWHPFQTCEDFEFSEIAHQAALNKDHMNKLLSLIQQNQIAKGKVKFTLQSHHDITKAWKCMAKLMTPFEKGVVFILHQKQDFEFDVHFCPLWDWAMGLLSNPILMPHFVWDAQCLYKHNRERFEWFVDEPWTGNQWWNIQSISGTVPVGSEKVPADSGNEDYKEQCIMALIRGLKSHCPCPICLVPSDQLCNHTSTYPMHMSLDAITSLEVYKRSQKDGEALMQKQSLQPVKNAFWRINHSDPHRALSFDHLHYDDMGIGDHLFKETKKNLAEIGHHAEKAVDDHDGNKLTDIVKQLPFTAQSVLSPRKHPIGFALLWCIASYLSYHMYIILNIHTETTIATGECKLLAFQYHLEAYIDMLDPDSIQKNWDFPKAHLAKHAFQDIIEKGATWNYSTRPNESHHGPIRKYYLCQTNQKDMPEQILQLDHRSLVSEFICSWLDHDDEECLKWMLDRHVLEDQENKLLDNNVFSGHIYLGSPQPPIMIANVEKTFTSCPFQSFHKKLTHFLNEFLPLCDIPIPGGHSWFVVPQEDKLREFQYLKVNYESCVDWKVTMDYLRCNPNFHGCAVDKGLRFICLHTRPAALLEIIPLWSIIQGALLVPDFTNDGDYFLFVIITSAAPFRTVPSMPKTHPDLLTIGDVWWGKDYFATWPPSTHSGHPYTIPAERHSMSALAQLPGSFKLWKSYLQMRMSYMLGSPIHEERAGGGKKFPVLRDALEEHNYSEEWDSGLDGVISLEEWKSLIATYECTLTWLPKTLLLALKLPSYCCLWQGGLHVGSMSVLKGKVPTSYLGLLGHRLLFAEEVGLDVSDTVESNAMDARADAEAKVKELHLWMGNSYKKLLPMYNEDEDLLSKCKLNIEHIICKDGLRVYKDQAGCFWTDIATYWIIQGEFDRAKTMFKASIASALTTRDFTQIFQVYTKFCESIIGTMIEGLENPDEDEDEEDIKEMECNGWEKWVALWGDDDEKVAKMYTQALWTINPCKATANLFWLYINFVRYYEGGASGAAEPDLDTTHKHPGEGYQSRVQDH
ncbi:hypothetical protein BKA83DRAFT_4133141 [Pisolithus microcarpus]|nr:hypothetical protein BKA83DRAFT_4133141 [Pisolithus microcarpus]